MTDLESAILHFQRRLAKDAISRGENVADNTAWLNKNAEPVIHEQAEEGTVE